MNLNEGEEAARREVPWTRVYCCSSLLKDAYALDRRSQGAFERGTKAAVWSHSTLCNVALNIQTKMVIITLPLSFPS